MDEDFIRGRAEHIRELATKADPFIQKRLLDLADSYERRLRPPPHTAPRATGVYSQLQAQR
ncbi:hypothetical protein JQ617_09315 [Bradyrhizobium sp. KB893862 SZCCT0404]|uniref:hypothetical protein n=1 Tax=Bradyrhizobium sp. KB893862 SZCCT0404 TaxID=2807672 RepID=UPI001BA61D0B|nr:hypothetical protein [Bradyrhizobium sp. KB893862 SZCCT0404]MBR1174152.1 hypothetical protein [Bradyrhizobium sp. KB893862 SZCCT0404]